MCPFEIHFESEREKAIFLNRMKAAKPKENVNHVNVIPFRVQLFILLDLKQINQRFVLEENSNQHLSRNAQMLWQLQFAWM